MKNYLIIGGSSGIGASIADILMKDENNSILATYNNQIKNSSESLQFHHLNVLEEGWDLSFVPQKLDGLVYCPGSINLKPFHRIQPTAFTEDFELQVLGAIKILQKVLPNLKNSGNASVVLFSTVAVQNGFTFHSQVSVSKGAIEGLTRSLAAEWAPSIRVNAIAPSLTDTPLAENLVNNDKKREANAERHPLKRIGKPEDIAETAAFLLSDKSSWITGQVLHVDGGMNGIRG